MARTVTELEDMLYGWPEEGGFRHAKLLRLLAELEGRIEALERRDEIADQAPAT